MASDSSNNTARDLASALDRMLSPVVGTFVARTAIGMAAKRIGKPVEEIVFADAPAIADALKPPLVTLLGSHAAELLAGRVRALAESDRDGGEGGQ